MGRFLVPALLLLGAHVAAFADGPAPAPSPSASEPSDEGASSETKPAHDFYTDIEEPAYVGVSLGFPSEGFALMPYGMSQGLDWAHQLDYRPATNLEFNLHARYRFLSGTVTFHLPQIFPYEAQEGSSSYQRYGLSYFGRSVGVELSYSKIAGYLIENSSQLSAAALNGGTYYRLPQLENLGVGANFYFVLSPEVYSLSAAFDQGERQLRSAGSALLNLSFRNQTVKSPDSIIPSEKQSLFGSDGTMTGFSTTTVTFGGGYGFQVAFSSFFLSTAILAGLGPQLTQVVMDSSRTNLAPAAHANGHFSVGWNANNLLAGIGVLVEGYTALIQATALIHLGAEAKLFCGLRF